MGNVKILFLGAYLTILQEKNMSPRDGFLLPNPKKRHILGRCRTKQNKSHQQLYNPKRIKYFDFLILVFEGEFLVFAVFLGFFLTEIIYVKCENFLGHILGDFKLFSFTKAIKKLDLNKYLYVFFFFTKS